MNTQVVFNLDAKVKAKAMKRAKAEGVPFSSVLKMAAKQFAEGTLSVDLVEEIRPEKLRLWERQSRLIEQGKGKRFATAQEALDYLDSL